MIHQQALEPVLFSLNVPSHKGPPWHVLEVEIHEHLSGDYRAILQIESDDPLSDPMALLGAQAVLHMEREGLMAAPRDWAGVIRSVEESFAPDAGGRCYARVQIEPALACLKEEVQTRKFQEATVPQIVRDVLGTAVADLNRPVRSNLLREHEPPDSGLAYAVRDLCIQYGESTYDFLRRILAEDGIAHFFESDSERESVVLVDDNGGFVEHDRVVRLVPVAGMVRHEESISSFQLRQSRAPKQSLVRAFDPTRHLPIEAKRARADGELPAGAGEAVTYDPGTAVTLFGTKEESYAHSDVEAQVRLRLERAVTASVEGRGKSDILAFRPAAFQGDQRFRHW
jgi:type VI secretion system secreted protein VgrG